MSKEDESKFEMRQIVKDKRGLQLGDAIPAVLIIGLVFLIMATLAYIGAEYGSSLDDGTAAQNITTDLQTEIGDNTSIAGIVLTIVLVGIILGVLIGVFAGVRRG